jgi:formiminoglutamase
VKLPLLISVPHAGLKVPPEVQSYCALTAQQILEDSDEGATDIYALASDVTAFVTTDIARAVIDLNRSEDDRSTDGVVKTHTCWNVPVYHRPISKELIQRLLRRYYRPYHRRLTEFAAGAMLGVDCHTMSSVGPPLGPDPDSQRPDICLSNANGTCPSSVFDPLIDCFQSAFGCEVSVNSPFGGGHIIRTHACELPWIQLELSRAPFLSLEDKHNRVLEALLAFCDFLGDI